MREIKFRGKRVDNGKWVYGYYVCYHVTGGGELFHHIKNPNDTYQIVPETVGQYTGLKDKEGKEIYEGDIVRIRRVYRSTQTHTGDNIPNGSYTEPMEPAIKTIEGIVIFENTCFTIESDDLETHEIEFPLSSLFCDYTLDIIKDHISYLILDACIFDDPEEGDLQYLIEEVANVKNSNELIKYLSGIEVLGNIYDNPELL